MRRSRSRHMLAVVMAGGLAVAPGGVASATTSTQVDPSGTSTVAYCEDDLREREAAAEEQAAKEKKPVVYQSRADGERDLCVLVERSASHTEIYLCVLTWKDGARSGSCSEVRHDQSGAHLSGTSGSKCAYPGDDAGDCIVTDGSWTPSDPGHPTFDVTGTVADRRVRAYSTPSGVVKQVTGACVGFLSLDPLSCTNAPDGSDDWDSCLVWANGIRVGCQ